MSKKTKKLYEIVKFDQTTANLTKTAIDNRPSVWDVIGTADTISDAKNFAANISGRIAIRLADDPDPITVINDFYRIDPKKNPELAKSEKQKWDDSINDEY